MSNECPEDRGYIPLLDDQSSDSEIDSSDLEDITNDDENQESPCGFCQHPNAKKIVKQLYDGVRFCNKFCANRFHLKQTASLEDNETNPMAGNKNAKKKGEFSTTQISWNEDHELRFR